MSIRIPQKADLDTQNAFKDVAEELQSIDELRTAIRDLKQQMEGQQKQLDTTSPAPTLTQLGDTSIVGDLRVDGSLNVRGDVDAPQILDGLVVAVPAETGGASAAQRVVEVNASLAVLSALSAETVRARNLIVYGQADLPPVFSSRLSTNVVDVGNVGSGEDDLMTYTLPSNTLTTDGQVVRVTAWGRFATNSNVKLLKAYFGATGILVTIAGFSPSNAGWRTQFEIVRTGAAAQILIGHNIVRDAAGSSFVFTPAEVTPAETLTNDIVIKMTGEATSNDDIVQKGMIVELLP